MSRRRAIPTAVAGFALLLLWGPYGTLGRFLAPQGIQIMFTASAIILANRKAGDAGARRGKWIKP